MSGRPTDRSGDALVGEPPLSTLAAVYAVANILNAAVPFLLLPILTRVLTPADYGLVAMFGIVVAVLNAVVGLNSYGAVTIRYFQLDAYRMPQYVGACVAILIVSTLVIAVIVVSLSSFLTSITHLPATWLLVAVATSACQFIISIRLSLWQVEKRASVYGSFQIAQSCTNAGLSLLLVLAAGLAWQGRAIGQAAAIILFAMIAAVAIWRERRMVWSIERADVLDALRFGIPLVPHMTGALLISTVDRLMITNLLGIKDAGIYVVAAQIGLGLGLMTDAFNRAYAPWLTERLSRTSDPERDLSIVRGTYLYFGIVVGIAALIGVTAPFVMPLLVGPAFRGAASLIFYIALGHAFGGMYYMVTNYVFFAGRTSVLATITISVGLLNVVVSFLLIKQNGLVGAAQGFMLSQATLFLGTWLLAQRSRPMPWGQVVRRIAPTPGDRTH